MILRRLKIDRLPGIDESFEIESPGPGIHIIFGPNAIGKSSICRAVKSLFWDDLGPSERTSVSGQFELEGEILRAEREGPRIRWRSADEIRVPPGIPASHCHRSFFLHLRDLIDPSPDGTQDIASEIKRQMSGGYDLHHVLEDLFPQVSRGKCRSQRKAFNIVENKVQEAEGKQVGLQRRADERETLKTQLEEAATNSRRLPLVLRAIELASRVEELDSITKEIASLPNALANLTGQEVEQIDQLRDRIKGLEERIRTLQSQRDAARGAKEDSRLSAVVDKSDFTVWRQNAEELVRIDLELQNARTNRSECQSEVESALSALGRGNTNQVTFSLDEHHRLFEFLRISDEHRIKKRAIEWRLRVLETIEQIADGDSHLVDLRAAVELLRRWLRAPEPETTWERLKNRRFWILSAVIIAGVSTGIAILIDPRFGLLLAVAAGIMVPVLLMRGTDPDSSARTNVEKEFARLGTVLPEKWTELSVATRLRNLEEEVASIESRLQRARDRDVDRQTLNSELKNVTELEPQLDEQRKRLLEDLNLESMPPDAELADMAQALDQLRKARIKYEGVAGRVADLEKTHSGLLSTLAEKLQQHGEPTPENAKSAIAYLDNLSDRNAKLVKANDEERRASSQLEQIDADRNREVESIRQIYMAASLENEDLTGLTILLQSLPDYRNLKERAIRLENEVDLVRNDLVQAGERDLVDFDKAELERLAQGLSTAETKADNLRDEIAEINAEVNDASRSSNLQDLIAQREKSRMELQECRDEAIFAMAGRFLVDSVEREYEQNQMPRVLERARNHFSDFTLHGYELRLGRDAKSPRLFAMDLRNGESRELNELSDGTRAQLLLAARMAFAEEIERGVILPLFLDEALDQSDPIRFRAIASSLARIAHDQGRQIFYLTSDPLDRERIRHAIDDEVDVVVTDLDLGLIRNNAHSVTEPVTLEVPPKMTIPEPDGKSTEEYGVKLGVPEFSPLRGYIQQHFFYLLYDDLPLLYKLLQYGIERAGQWNTVSGTALAEQFIKYSSTASEIDFRVRLLEVFCEKWNQGRGRTIDRDVLLQSNAVSARFLNDIVDISNELGNDPEQLISVLLARKDPRMKGFRKSNVRDLEDYFRDNGFIDDRPIFDEFGLTVLALATPPAINLPNEVARESLRYWWALAVGIPIGDGRK